MIQNNYEVTLTSKFQSNKSGYVSLFSVTYLADLTYLTEENYLTERKETRPLYKAERKKKRRDADQRSQLHQVERKKKQRCNDV